jgi:HAE1 family hydrophobic/amphiphilic exporter-1
MYFTVKDPKNPQAKGRSVRLGDVANVLDTVQERTVYSRLDKNDSIVLAIQKSKDGNAVEITKGADAVITQIGQEFKDDHITVVKTLEAAKQITESLDDMRFALMFGILLVTIIVYIFLHNFRGMMIVALAIPTSIFATFIALKAMGFTINNLSMLSLSLAIGVLVDDAIVVLENIYRHLKMGEDPREAALNGRSEIGLAAIAITLADVVVFLPIAFMGGIVGQFFKPLALGFVAATLFSLFVSFTLTPMLASRWYQRGEDLEHPTGRFAIWFEKGFSRLERAYRHALEWALSHRWFVFILGNAALFAVFMFIGGGFAGAENPMKAIPVGMPLLFVSIILGVITFVINMFRGRAHVKYIINGALFGLIFPAAALVGGVYGHWKGDALFKFAFLPSSDSGQVSVTVELPAGSNLAATEKVVRQVENRVEGNPDAKYVLSSIGTQGAGNGFGVPNTGSNYGQVLIALVDRKAFLDNFKPTHEHLRTRSSESVAAELLQKIGRVPGAIINVSAGDAFGFGSAIQMSFRGDDHEKLLAVATKIRDMLKEGKLTGVKGVINPDISSKPGRPEIVAVPDRARLADSGLDAATVGSALRTLYQGNDDAKFRVEGKEYVIRTMLDLKDRDNPDVIPTVPIKFSNGNPITLQTVTNLVPAPALDKIDRRDREEEVRVTADLLPGYAAGSVQATIDNALKNQHLVPEGVSYKPLGQADAQGREMIFMLTAFATGIILVYMLLASLYDNLLYPLVIQLAQPQAMTGALLALVLTDQQLNLVGFIGLVALVGLVGKNAILVVDYTNTLRERGRSRHDALVEAGPTRLRPILMTTLALIMGMLPVALAIGRGSEFRQTIGIIVIGGISLSTLLTLLVIPCSYTIFDDMSLQLAAGIRSLLALLGVRRPPSPPAADERGTETKPAPANV